MINYRLTDKQLLIIRTSDQKRSGWMDKHLLDNGWIASACFQYGALLFEAWTDPAGIETPAPSEDYVSIAEAASELGISTNEIIDRMLDDGLLLEIDGRLVASPHPDVKKIGG